MFIFIDRLCGLVLGVPGYRSRGRVRFPALPVGLEWGPLSLVNTVEKLLGRESSGSGLEIREYGRGILYPQKFALTLPTRGGRSVGIACSRTQATEFSC
jgi:hypothetical protein